MRIISSVSTKYSVLALVLVQHNRRNGIYNPLTICFLVFIRYINLSELILSLLFFSSLDLGVFRGYGIYSMDKILIVLVIYEFQITIYFLLSPFHNLIVVVIILSFYIIQRPTRQEYIRLLIKICF